MGITTRQLSADLDVTTSRISEIVNGKRAISAETALRLGLFSKMESRFWLNLQAEFDMRVAERELHAQIAPRIRVFVPVLA
jgi:addiction module HigA family antidote